MASLRSDGDINEIAAIIRSFRQRDPPNNHVLRLPARQGRFDLRHVDGEKRPAANPVDSVNAIDGGDVDVGRRSEVDPSAGWRDEVANGLQLTSARGRAAAGGGWRDKHERVQGVINPVEKSDRRAGKVVGI